MPQERIPSWPCHLACALKYSIGAGEAASYGCSSEVNSLCQLRNKLRAVIHMFDIFMLVSRLVVDF